MNLNTIKVIQFRNLSNIFIDNFSRTNIIIGDNSQGKTNFLEAIYVLINGFSFKNVKFSDLQKWNSDGFYIYGEIDENILEIKYKNNKKIRKLNNKIFSIKDNFIYIPVIELIPDDIKLIDGSSEEKRYILDKLQASIDNEYLILLNKYYKILKQRNAQLKISQNETFIWDNELIKNGSELIKRRIKFIKLINQIIKKEFPKLFDIDIELKYFNNFKIENDDIEKSFQNSLKSNIKNDFLKKYTTIGPHRDSYEVIFYDKKAKLFFSQGQKRIISILFKLGVCELINNIKNIAPIILLDDIFVELDKKRKELLLERIIPFYQTFITLQNKEILNFDEKEVKIFKIENGNLL